MSQSSTEMGHPGLKHLNHAKMGYMHHRRGRHLILDIYCNKEADVFLSANLYAGCVMVQTVYVECSSMYHMYVLSKYIMAFYFCYGVCISMNNNVYTIALVHIDIFQYNDVCCVPI